MEAEDKSTENDEKIIDAELLDEISNMVARYLPRVEEIKDLERNMKEHLVNSIDRDLELIGAKAKTSGLENSEEIKKSLNKLQSIKELFENSL